jgi:hypothetical protein
MVVLIRNKAAFFLFTQGNFSKKNTIMLSCPAVAREGAI